MPALDAAARFEIQDLMARWAMAFDFHAYDELREIFTADGRYVTTNGRDITGVEEIIAWCKSRVRPGAERVTRHGLSNVLLTAEDDDVVTGISTWHTFASNEAEPAAVPVFQVADFTDRYRRVDGRWWLAERVTASVFRDETLAP